MFDRAGRLIQAIDGDQITTFSYYENGTRKKVVYPDGSKEEYTYYADNLLKTLVNTNPSGGIIDSYTYTYDGAHNQISKTDRKGMTRYTYDSLNRLETVNEPTGRSTSYGYDAAGNRIREVVTLGTLSTITTYTYNEQNRLLDTVEQAPDAKAISRYVYDNNGNMVSRTEETIKQASQNDYGSIGLVPEGDASTGGLTLMEYDGWNRLVKTASGSTEVTYAYNGDGQRVEKIADGEIIRYLYEGTKVILEVDGQGAQQAKNVYGTNLISRTAGSDTMYYMYNGHGDVTALLDGDGTVKATYYYDAFGNHTEETGNVDNPYRYAGYRYDAETDLYYLNARYYDSKLARFISEDIFRGQANDPLSLNLYTYCHNEPIMYTDPTGHWERGDENLTPEAQKQIIRLTDLYASEKDLNKKYEIHLEAVEIRSNSANYDPTNTKKNSEFVRDINKALDSGGVITENEWVGARIDDAFRTLSNNKDSNNVSSSSSASQGTGKGNATNSNEGIFSKIDNKLSNIASNMPDIVKTLNNQVNPNVNWLDGGTFKIGVQNPVSGIIDYYIEVKVGDTPVKSKLEVELFSNENVKASAFISGRFSLSFGTLSTSHGVAVETDDYSLSATQSASLSIKDIGKNSVGKVYEKTTLSNKPDGNVPKISISIVKENDPLRQIECAAIITAAVLAPEVSIPLAGLSGAGTQASQLIPAIK